MLKNYVPPTDSERRIASDAAVNLELPQDDTESIKYFIYDSVTEESIELPTGAIAILRDVLRYISYGHGITLFPRLAEVTTMEAAEILNVSRPYVIKLLAEGEIPYRRVGSHRRIRLEDVLDYDAKSKEGSKAAMDEIVALSQELGLYD